MTTHDLVETLMDRRGSFATTIVAATDPRLLKRGNPFVGVTKLSRVNGFLNWHYQNAVNAQRGRENCPLDEDGMVEPFIALPRKWGVRLQREDGTLTPFVVHDGRYYLEMKVQRAMGHEYRIGDTIIDPAEIRPFLPKRTEGARQQVANPVILRDYSVDNIIQITLDGIVHDIE